MTSSNKQKPTQSRGHGSGSCAIGVLTKAPRIGFSKTRLCPPLQPPDCQALSRCFIQDTAENVSAIALASEDIVPVAVYTPVGSEPDVKQLLPGNFILIPQRGESLGDRLFHAAQDLFQGGFDSVCLLALRQMTLPVWYDVDDGPALERLIDDLFRDHSSPRSSSAYSAAHNGRLLNSILLRPHFP